MAIAMAQRPDDHEYATKGDLRRVARTLQRRMDEGFARCATTEDVERMGRVLAWGLIGGMGVMLAATLAGMWGVVHTLVSLAN